MSLVGGARQEGRIKLRAVRTVYRRHLTDGKSEVQRIQESPPRWRINGGTMSNLISFLHRYFKEPVLLPPPDRSVQRGSYTDHEMIQKLKETWRQE